MRRIKNSFGHAVMGLMHALEKERNLQLFVPCYLLVLVLGGIVQLLIWEWLALMMAGGIFFAVELINTSIERLSNLLDEERKLLGRKSFHENMKATKDVAAAASLVSLIVLIAVILLVFWPYADMYLLH